MRPSRAVINLSYLKRNFLNIKKKLKNDIKIMAVVKADAYGHGVEETVKALNSLESKKPDYYAVAIPDEALQLRKLKINQPILVFDPFAEEEMHKLFNDQIIPTVFSDEHLKILSGNRKISDSTKLRRKPIKVQVKVDTGMNRLGIYYDKAFGFISKLSKKSNFVIDGIYTHFATADYKDNIFTNLQLKRFNDLIGRLKSENINYGIAHAANSGAILNLPEAQLDMVRPGIIIFGYYPSLNTTESIPVEPVMSIISHISSIKRIKKGDTVSYGRKFKAKKETNIISIPIGYADGFSRLLSNKSEAIINGKKYKQVGTITMDRTMFDVGEEKFETGEKVIIIGKQKNEKISAWDWAKTIGTIPYEITCNFSKRVPRIYVN